MWGLHKWTPANFFQALAYQRGGKVLLMLGLFVVLSLAVTTFGSDRVLDVMASGDPNGIDSSAGGSPSNAVRSLQEVKDATIHIEAQGSFVEPDGGRPTSVATVQASS